MKKTYKIVICTHSSQSIEVIRKLFSLGYKNNEIYCIAVSEKSGNVMFIDFVEWNKMDYSISNSSSDDEFILNDLSYDYLISVSWRNIFSNKVLQNAKKGNLNFHPGYLPNYKGCFSVSWAIINNEKKVGYTWHEINEQIDGGRILLRGEVDVNDETSHSLHYKVFREGVNNIAVVIHNFEEKKYIKNDVLKGKYYNNKLPYNGVIDREWSPNKIKRFIRAMYFPPFKPAVVLGGVEHECETFFDYIRIVKKG